MDSEGKSMDSDIAGKGVRGVGISEQQFGSEGECCRLDEEWGEMKGKLAEWVVGGGCFAVKAVRLLFIK